MQPPLLQSNKTLEEHCTSCKEFDSVVWLSSAGKHGLTTSVTSSFLSIQKSKIPIVPRKSKCSSRGLDAEEKSFCIFNKLMGYMYFSYKPIYSISFTRMIFSKWTNLKVLCLGVKGMEFLPP